MKSIAVGIKRWIFITLSSFIIIFISGNSINANWISAIPPYVSNDWWLEGVYLTSPNEGWAVGKDDKNYKGVLLHYLNGSWTSVTPPDVSSEWSLSGVHFTSPNEGWAVGKDDKNHKGVLLHYFNGIWNSVPPPEVSSGWYLNSVHFTSPNEGWVVGGDSNNQRGVLLHYLNGIWTSITPPDADSYWSLNSVHLTSPNEGWAVGEKTPAVSFWKSVLIHYLDGNWVSVPPPDIDAETKEVLVPAYFMIQPPCVGGKKFFGTHFTLLDEGWAVGSDFNYCSNDKGILFHYLNGTWTSVPPPNVSLEWSLSGVHFTSPNEGWAVGEDRENSLQAYTKGVLLHYLNGIWTSVIPPFVSPVWYLFGVYFSSSNDGWAVGKNDWNGRRGVLLKYSIPDLTGNWDSVNQTCRMIFDTERCNIKGSFNIQNIGSQASSSSTVNFYLSDDQIYDVEDILLMQKKISNISAGSNRVIYLRSNLHQGINTSGKYIIALIDVENAVSESNENNNQIAYGPIP